MLLSGFDNLQAVVSSDYLPMSSFKRQFELVNLFYESSDHKRTNQG